MHFEGRVNRSAAILGVCEERNENGSWLRFQDGKIGKEHITVVFVCFPLTGRLEFYYNINHSVEM